MLLSSLLAVAIASSASPPPEMALSAQRWTVDYSQVACTLARPIAGTGSPILAINAPLGNEPGELLVMDQGSGLDSRLTGDLRLRLDGDPPVGVHAGRERRNGSSVVRLAPLPDDFLERLAGARRLSVSNGDQAVFAVALGNARAGVDELARCNEDLLQSWGIDVAARRALRERPHNTNTAWGLAILPSADTFAVLTAEISENGRPLECRIVVSSGNARMDAGICRTMRSRARFRPALDSTGRPVRAQYVTRIRWTVR